MIVLRLIFLQHIRLVAEEINDFAQEIVKIVSVVLSEQLLVFGIDAPGDLVEVGIGREVFGRDEFVLGFGYRREQ